jgi:hypothetical protein
MNFTCDAITLKKFNEHTVAQLLEDFATRILGQ